MHLRIDKPGFYIKIENGNREVVSIDDIDEVIHNLTTELYSRLTIDFRNCDSNSGAVDKIYKALLSTQFSTREIKLYLEINSYVDAEKLCHFIVSKLCPPGLTIHLYVLSPQIIAAFKYNTDIYIDVKWPQWLEEELKLVNRRNLILKKYPTYTKEILDFCQKKNLFYSHSVSEKFTLDTEVFHKEEIQQFMNDVSEFKLNTLRKYLGLIPFKKLMNLAKKQIDDDYKLAFLQLPLIKLLQNDLIVVLYQENKNDEEFTKKIKTILRHNIKEIQLKKSLSMTALLLVTGLQKERYSDPVSVYLLAYYLSDEKSKDDWYDVLKFLLDEDTYSVNEIHFILAKSIDNYIFSLLCCKCNKENILVKTDAAKSIQNIIRTKNRTQEIYPFMFKIPESSPENCYLFWKEKPRSKILALKKTLRNFALKYTYERAYTLKNGQTLNFISKFTKHYVLSHRSFENIIRSSNFLSQDARHNLSMYGFTSENTYQDKLIRDNWLVCTAPLSVLPAFLEKYFAIIHLELDKMPEELKKVIIKMSDYSARSESYPIIAITPEVTLELEPYPFNDCTLLKMSSDPQQSIFSDLPLENDLNALILYDGRIFYADRRNKNVTEIYPSKKRDDEFKALIHCFQDEPTRLDKNDYDLFHSVTKIISIDTSRSPYKFCYKKISYTLHLNGMHEIYHGIEGFKEAMCHFLFVLHSLPDEGDGKHIKDAIISHFSALDASQKLHAHLDEIFKNLFKFMEIDFQYGLPFSLEYINAITFHGNNGIKVVNVENLLNLFEPNDFNANETQFLKNDTIMYHVLQSSRPENLMELAEKLEELHPGTFIDAINKLFEMNLKNPDELKQIISGNILSPSQIIPRYCLIDLIEEFKNKLSKDKYFCRNLIENNKTKIDSLKNYVRECYNNFSFSGGESKLRELFSDPTFIYAITGKNKEVLAAIIAYDILWENTEKPCPELLVQTVTSQRNNQPINITLHGILYNILKQSTDFLKSYPVNTSFEKFHNESLIHWFNRTNLDGLKKSIFQRTLFNNIYPELEKSIVNLCQSMPDIACNKFRLHESNILDLTDEIFEDYGAEIETLDFIEDSFCQNPQIIKEVNNALHLLPLFLFKTDKKPTCRQLVNQFINSTVLVNPFFAHLLFDATHFPVALKGHNIKKITLAVEQQGDPHEMSLYDLIKASVNMFTHFGINPDNALMAEQLALRLEKLRIDFKSEISAFTNFVLPGR